MSAGPNARPLGKIGWQDDKGDFVPPEKLWGFSCLCGYRGTADELLAENDNDTLYCPQCGTIGWIWD